MVKVVGGWEGYIKDLGISKVGSQHVYFSMRSIWHLTKPKRGVCPAGGTLVSYVTMKTRCRPHTLAHTVNIVTCSLDSAKCLLQKGYG